MTNRRSFFAMLVAPLVLWHRCVDPIVDQYRDWSETDWAKFLISTQGASVVFKNKNKATVRITRQASETLLIGGC